MRGAGPAMKAVALRGAPPRGAGAAFTSAGARTAGCPGRAQARTEPAAAAAQREPRLGWGGLRMAERRRRRRRRGAGSAGGGEARRGEARRGWARLGRRRRRCERPAGPVQVLTRRQVPGGCAGGRRKTTTPGPGAAAAARRGGVPGLPPLIPIPSAAPAMFRFILAWHCPWATCSQRPGKHGAGGWQQARLQGAGDV